MLAPTRIRVMGGDALESLQQMSKLRTSAIGGWGILIVVHVWVLVARYGSDTASVWGDWIDTLAPLVATVVCWVASRKAGPFGGECGGWSRSPALLTAIGRGSTPNTTTICTRSSEHFGRATCLFSSGLFPS